MKIIKVLLQIQEMTNEIHHEKLVTREKTDRG